MTQEDVDIQILLDQAAELYSSLLVRKTTIAAATCSEMLIKLETATEKKNHELAQTSKASNYGFIISLW